MALDPWGDVLAEGPEETPAIVRAEIDTDRVAEVRHRIPSLTNRRPEVY
jgi:predicted amidohydrolase